ncbi:protein pellino-like isoform X2 [Tubulanus polymorphus]|uniref:protein pellino-like isoform X2 n=1 Tax=Tubulanus polymorphus TaxID=672921 RepID=UPI003DA6C7DD
MVQTLRDGDSKKENKKIKSPLKFGELIVLGYNGSLPEGDKGRRRSKFSLLKRPKSNGVKPGKKHVVKNPQTAKAVLDSNCAAVSYTLSRNQAVVIEYEPDETTDMFQIGRSSESPIDFVVLDTVPGAQKAEDCIVSQSTISRFACRILVDRSPPYTARIYAAGFDSARNIFLGEKATKWQNDKKEIDGLTTNGVLIMHPVGGFNDQSKAGLWREVSVGGGVYELRESRSTPKKSNLIEDEENILYDGTLIDLCGATLLWRSALGLLSSPSRRELDHQIEEINAGRPQCPVGLNTLVIPNKNTLTVTEKQPYVYLKCGHVHGKHEWGASDEAGNRTCPMCRETGPFQKLQMGNEPSLYVDSELPTHTFNPCGHMSSEKTIKYWASIPIPYGCHGFIAVCPFCATPLKEHPGYVKVIWQDNVD